VTGRVRDIGQNVLQYSFVTGSSSSSSPSYCHIVFHIAFLEEAFISKLIVILRIHYIIMFFFLLALQPKAGYGLLIHEVFLDHTQPTQHSR